EGVVLGGDDDVAPDDDRLGPDGTVQVGVPLRRQGGDGGRVGGLAAATGVLVVDGPGGGEGRRGRCGGDGRRRGCRRAARRGGGGGGGLGTGRGRAGHQPRRHAHARRGQGGPRTASSGGQWCSGLPVLQDPVRVSPSAPV